MGGGNSYLLLSDSKEVLSASWNYRACWLEGTSGGRLADLLKAGLQPGQNGTKDGFAELSLRLLRMNGPRSLSMTCSMAALPRSKKVFLMSEPLGMQFCDYCPLCWIICHFSGQC